MTIVYLSPNHSDGLVYSNFKERNEMILKHEDAERYSLSGFIAGFNNDEISDLGYAVVEEDPNEVVVNHVELVSELAEEMLRNQLMGQEGLSEGDIYIPAEYGGTKYSDYAQERFNNLYDKYYNKILEAMPKLNTGKNE